jgi:glycosyltransferase involved in cell wall biosynthesis
MGGVRVAAGDIPCYLRRYAAVTAWEWVSARLVDGVIAVSPDIVEDAVRYYRLADRCAAVIPSCVDVDFWSPGREDAAAARAPDCPPFLLYVGNPSRRKGFHFVLEALVRLRRRMAALTVQIAGSRNPYDDGEWYVPWIRRLGLADHVQMLGVLDRPQLRDLYRRAALLLYPSIHEGSPRVVKEAAACGCPVVTCRIPGTEVIDPRGQFLRYCRREDAESLAAEAETVLRSPRLRESLCRIGRQRMVERFSPKTIARHTADFYERLYR